MAESPAPAAMEIAPKVEAVARMLSSEICETSSGRIYKTQCKICNSPLRMEAEKMMEDGKPLSEVKVWLDGQGLVIAIQNIRHHFNEHFKSMERMLCLYDYCQNLEALQRQRRSRQDDLEMLVNIGRMEIARIASLPTGGRLDKEKERAQMLSLAVKGMKEAIQALNEMEDAEAKAKAIQHKFVEVWKNMIDQAPTEEQKKLLVATLQRFKKALEDSPEAKP